MGEKAAPDFADPQIIVKEPVSTDKIVQGGRINVVWGGRSSAERRGQNRNRVKLR
jgi:hypothetical protein